MKNPKTNPTDSIYSTPTSLYKLVSSLQAGLLPLAVDRKSIIINDIDKTISVLTDEDTLAFIIGGLISNAVYSTSNCCIRVEALCVEDGIQVQVRNNGAFMYNNQMRSLCQITDAARKLGASIGLYREEELGLTVVLSIVRKIAA
jgi:signal transduction histidine kinase